MYYFCRRNTKKDDMNITEIPRTMVYKEIEVIKDILGNDSDKTLEREFYDRLVKRPFIKESNNPPKWIRTIFNNARYIYYLLICEEDDPSQCFKIYLSKAGEGTAETDMKSHITAATMALMYNWLDFNLHDNIFIVPETQEKIYQNFNKSIEKDIIKLKQEIYNYYSDKKETVKSEIKEDFLELLIEDYNFRTNMNESSFDVPYYQDFAKSWFFPVQDVAEGIDYIIDGLDIPFENNRERIGFLDEILNRFDKEQSSVTNYDVLELAKNKIECEKQRLLSTPKMQSSSLELSIDNLYTVPASWDGNIDTLISGVDSCIEFPKELQSEEAQAMLEKAKEVGWLDNNLQPILSSTEAAVLAVYIADKLNFREVWKVFGALWHRSAGTMRAKYNLAQKQIKNLDFQDKIKEVLKNSKMW